METFYSTVKPLFLTPIAGGYPLGLFRNGNFKTTAIATLIGILLAGNCVTSLGATLLSRYLLIFPSKLTKCFSLKTFVWFTFTLTVAVTISGSICIIQMLSFDEKEMHQAAMEYDPFLSIFFNESSFIFMPYSTIEIPLLIIWIIIILFYICAFLTILTFISSLKSHTKTIVTALQRSLIISSLAQTLLTCLFLVFPLFVLATSVYFQISNSAENFFIVYCFLVSHSILECIATLYFVIDYRKFLIKIFDRIFRRKPKISSFSILLVK